MGNLPVNYDVKSLPDLGALLLEDKRIGRRRHGTAACETAHFVAA
jgi:hypothetical protein